MAKTTELAKKHQHQLVVMVMLWAAWTSLGRFPGVSGWLGCAGLIMLATTIFLTPSLLSTDKAMDASHRRGTVIAVGTSLTLMVASVVAWSVARH